MLAKFVRRAFSSQIIKADAAADGSRVVQAGRKYYE